MFSPSGLPKALQVLALLGLFSPPASVALAQAPGQNADIATYQGPDRTQRLIAGARRKAPSPSTPPPPSTTWRR
jgi:hypothetical protein